MGLGRGFGASGGVGRAGDGDIVADSAHVEASGGLSGAESAGVGFDGFEAADGVSDAPVGVLSPGGRRRLSRVARKSAKVGGDLSDIGGFIDGRGRVRPLDKRKDRQRGSRAVAWVTVSLIVAGLVGGGAYLAVNRPLTRGDVQGQIDASIHETGFPMERGEAFARRFAEAYVSADGSETSEKTLSYFYTGTLGKSASVTGASLSRPKGGSYRLVGDVNVFEVLPRTADVSVYKVQMLVVDQQADGDGAATVNPSPHWLAFEVSVYYDKAKDMLMIPSNSPSLIPAPAVGASADAPAYTDPGTGQAYAGSEESALRGAVFGFLDAYGKASPGNHTLLDQYVSPNADVSIFNGFNGEFEVAGGAESSVDVRLIQGEDASHVRALATVKWSQVQAGSSGAASGSASSVKSGSSASGGVGSSAGSSVSGGSASGYAFESQYVVALVKDGSRWAVERFEPFRLNPAVS
jgi:hypothetical protein